MDACLCVLWCLCLRVLLVGVVVGACIGGGRLGCVEGCCEGGGQRLKTSLLGRHCTVNAFEVGHHLWQMHALPLDDIQ